MNDPVLSVRNGVSIDTEIDALCTDLDSHISEKSLPDYGLILAYNFPPFADASSVTVAKRIRQLGRKVDVVSQDLSAIRKRDEDLSTLISEFVVEHFRLTGEPGFAAWPSIRNYVLDGYAAVKTRLRNNQYGFIYSRSMFPATHFLAAFIKTRHPDVLWISEFSDPVRHDVEGNDRLSPDIPDDYVSRELISRFVQPTRNLLLKAQTIFSWCESLGIVAADRVIFTNAHQRKVMLEPYKEYFPAEDFVAKSVVSPHPTLGPAFYEKSTEVVSLSQPGLLDIGYFGEFYPNRGVGELVRAVSSLEEGVREKFRVHVFTSNVAAAQRSLGGLSYDTSFVKIAPSKNLFSFLKLASEMDALYVCDVSTGLGYDKNPYLPSKFSDYRGAKVPIIASVWPGSVLSKNQTINRVLIGDTSRLVECLRYLAKSG